MPLCMLCPTIWSSKKKRINSSGEECHHSPTGHDFRFSVRGNPTVASIGVNSGVNNVTTNNINYGRAHGLEKMETFVSFAAHHNSAEQDPDRRCHPGTRKSVLTSIQNWIDNPSMPERIFWLHGPAGAGKSAIAQTIAHSNTRENVAATFFFYRSDPSRNDGNRLFTTLAWQLAFSIPDVKPFIVDALEKQPDLPRANVETQFDQLIVQPFRLLSSQIPQSMHTLPVIIIDGVDECADEKLQQRFLKVIGNAFRDSRLPLRFLICSRPEADIQATIDRFRPPPLSIDLAKLDDANYDIEKYLKDEFSRIASDRDLDQKLWPGEQIIQELIFKSSGYFIFAATVIRCVDDPDNSPEAQLDIILGLKPIKSTSPFALLDELYVDILRRQLDQDFLKTFLALLVGRSSVRILVMSLVRNTNLADDDVTLLNISKKELHIKLRRMRSLLSFKPHIDVYHRSFFDFLLDPSRSNQYHVSREGGITRYLELIVDWIVQYAARVIEQFEHHIAYHFRPQFVNILDTDAVNIPLPVEGWRKALQPLLLLQDKLFGLSNFNPITRPCTACFAFYTMRCLLLRFAILQGSSHPTAKSVEQCGSSTPSTLLTVTGRDVFEIDSLSSLFTWLRNSKSVEPLSTAQTITLVRVLLRFDCSEVVSKVLSVADAQRLVDIIDRVINDQNLLRQFRPYEIGQATHLALRLFVKAPVLPRSLFLERKDSSGLCNAFPSGSMQLLLHTAFMGRILDRNICVPSFRTCVEAKNFRFRHINNANLSMREWRKMSNPRSVVRIKAMLAVAKAFQYFNSLGIVLDHSYVSLGQIFLDSKLCASIQFQGVLSDLEDRWTFKANIFSFGCFFYETYFNIEIEDSDRKYFNRNVIVKRPSKPKIRNDVWQLIQRCCAEDPNNRPTIDAVIKEMESWNLV